MTVNDNKYSSDISILLFSNRQDEIYYWCMPFEVGEQESSYYMLNFCLKNSIMPTLFHSRLNFYVCVIHLREDAALSH